ncbi:AMP-binding protein [Pluralibacter gergoviae]|uniref:AMP-binding protein n=1 Tax=Pluralibacter gergoviae TaxID=61647 RepID=UPI0006ABF871|nr:AMP-binding protein [Pluralibacter gergoviae]EKW6620657.1 AMP-binding protein [Pluralibacter gergoviae]KOQ92737.1 hypothetical protein ABW48_20340 [Pluralibacter gergoviae]OHY64396.1 hypothetical protein BB778_20430 [Pluralibacter gergoviae]
MSAADREKDAISWNRLVARHGVTIWRSVPTILEMLLASRTAESLGSLRLVGLAVRRQQQRLRVNKPRRNMRSWQIVSG